jgi:hypothetical protein
LLEFETNPSVLSTWAKPWTLNVSQRMPIPGASDTLTPLQRTGISLLSTSQRGAVHFQCRSDHIITEGFLDQHDQP